MKLLLAFFSVCILVACGNDSAGTDPNDPLAQPTGTFTMKIGGTPYEIDPYSSSTVKPVTKYNQSAKNLSLTIVDGQKIITMQIDSIGEKSFSLGVNSAHSFIYRNAGTEYSSRSIGASGTISVVRFSGGTLAASFNAVLVNSQNSADKISVSSGVMNVAYTTE